jgi:hypothetical protein
MTPAGRYRERPTVLVKKRLNQSLRGAGHGTRQWSEELPIKIRNPLEGPQAELQMPLKACTIKTPVSRIGLANSNTPALYFALYRGVYIFLASIYQGIWNFESWPLFNMSLVNETALAQAG